LPRPSRLKRAVAAVDGGKSISEAAHAFDVRVDELRAACIAAGVKLMVPKLEDRKIRNGTTLRRATIVVGGTRRALKISLAHLTADEVDVTYLDDRIEIRPVRS
jgi:hypothetical protein